MDCEIRPRSPSRDWSPEPESMAEQDRQLRKYEARKMEEYHRLLTISCIGEEEYNRRIEEKKTPPSRASPNQPKTGQENKPKMSNAKNDTKESISFPSEQSSSPWSTKSSREERNKKKTYCVRPVSRTHTGFKTLYDQEFPIMRNYQEEP